MYDLEKERSFILDTDKHLSCRRLRIIAESYAIKGLYACLLRFCLHLYLEIYLVNAHLIHIAHFITIFTLSQYRSLLVNAFMNLRIYTSMSFHLYILPFKIKKKSFK